MVERLETAGVVKDLVTLTGNILNANTLRKMNLIKVIGHVPQPILGVRNRRGPVLAEFETLFLNEQPDIKVHYLNVVKKGSVRDAPAGISRQKASTSKSEASEDVSEAAPKVAANKERRTKRKVDLPSVNEENNNQEEVAAEVDENVVVEEVVAKENLDVLVENENIQQEDAEKKKKNKKSKKEDVEKEVEMKKKNKKKKKKLVVVEKRSEEDVNKEEEEKEASRKRELALEKIKVVYEKKKRKGLEADSEGSRKKSKESVPTEVPQPSQPENQPQTAPVEPPQITKVLTPPSSPITNTASDHPIDTLKPRNLRKVQMAASSSHKADSSSPSQQHQQEEEELFYTPLTCTIPWEDLEVICKLIVDFDNLEEH
ncbi:uncharacterized protein LOC131604670 [Vicia villosa]|uniref:uncharacterized protein LOC131604670 n=1 Tax=Vicia villosa TaxID=3911 RepID=UPI00273BCC1B|nr:uncharacterized protein LOC131604670 [Vicia villosa]